MSAPEQLSADLDQTTVELTVPAAAAHASTVRLLVSSLAADLGFTVDDIDDVRLALSEVFTAFVEAAPAVTRVLVTFTTSAGQLEAAVAWADTSAAPVQLDELAATIVRAATDKVRVEAGRISVTKRGGAVRGSVVGDA